MALNPKVDLKLSIRVVCGGFIMQVSVLLCHQARMTQPFSMWENPKAQQQFLVQIESYTC